MTQPPYESPHGFAPSLRVTLASSSFPPRFKGISSWGICSSRYCHLNAHNVALDNVLNSPITNMVRHSFRQQMDESNHDMVNM